MITVELLNELFDYRDGKLYWKKSSKGRTVGREAGSVNSAGYRIVMINYKHYLAHRIIYFMFNNKFTQYVDHIDCDKLNNRIENLREATVNQNHQNTKLDGRNKTGVKNVSKRGNKYRVGFTHHRKSIHCGYYDTLEEAEKAAKINRIKLHQEFARHE